MGRILQHPLTSLHVCFHSGSESQGIIREDSHTHTHTHKLKHVCTLTDTYTQTWVNSYNDDAQWMKYLRHLCVSGEAGERRHNEWYRNRQTASGSIMCYVDFKSGLLSLRNSWITADLDLFICNPPPPPHTHTHTVELQWLLIRPVIFSHSSFLPTSPQQCWG